MAGKQAGMKPADFGKAIGIDKPANVRDKIRKWQVDLDADDSGTENVVASTPKDDETPAPSPKLLPTPKLRPLGERASPKPGHSPTKSVEALPERPKSAKKPAHNRLDDEVHLATAPKKRVISDSRWRTAKSPPKDAANRPSPKPLPTAWVRPAIRRDSASKIPTPTRPEPKPILIFGSKNAVPRTRSARQRRRSRPNSSGNEERPTSSGSAGLLVEKDTEDTNASPPPPLLDVKVEVARVRRRRRAATSPRGSQSPASGEDGGPIRRRRSPRRSRTPPKELPVNEDIVDDHPPREDNSRERRRRSQRRDHLEEQPQEPAPSGRRRARRKSPQQDTSNDSPPPPLEEEVPETPPKPFGSRLEAWLSTTPDPFVDADSRTRRHSKESTSTLEPPRRAEKSDVSGSTDTKEPIVEEAEERQSSNRRRRRPRGPSVRIETRDVEDKESAVTTNESIDTGTTITTTTTTTTTTEDSDRTPSPSLTLKRRGARRTQQSPVKDRMVSSPLRESVPQDEDAESSVLSSVLSSSVDASSVADQEGRTPKPHPDALAMRRFFPSTGKRLSTIVSVETFATKMQEPSRLEAVGSDSKEAIPESSKTIEDVPASESGDHFNPETLTIVSRKSTKRSRLASHADLISVLSMPRAGTRSIMSARSIRTNRSRLATATLEDVMKELASDETKYMRELRTLVDGVIPVLLSCVLSKSDSAVAAGLFSTSAKIDPSDVTKPIVDMGISLERLKSVHKRVPKEDPDAFLSWAQTAQRVYSDYINVWRLGFQDVVVSLASADEDPFTPAKVINGPDDAAPWDEGLPRNAEGYVVNGDGERVDVAYMLKRPLVRLKYLAKSMRGINHVKPSEKAEKMSNVYTDLMSAARKRTNDERARLEDEAAANIDPTRARDPRSLAPLAGVRIDPTRCVRARDYFDMHLLHSSGQEVNCRVELLLRDDAPGRASGGDVLLCEVDGTGRWLFLPPIQQGHISARNGDLQGEIIVMMRGYHSDGSEWREVFSLQSDDEQAGFEWVNMLGLQPIPPQLSELKRDPSILNKTPRPSSSHATSSLVSEITNSTQPLKSRTPSPREIEIPIGEQAKPSSKRWGYDTPEKPYHSREVSPITPPSNEVLRLKGKHAVGPVSPPSPVQLHGQIENSTPVASTKRTARDEDDLDRTPRSLNEAMTLAGNDGSPLSLKRSKAKRLSKNLSPSQESSRSSRQIVLDDPVDEIKPPRRLSRRQRSEQQAASSLSQSSKGFSVWMPMSDVEVELDDESDEEPYPEEIIEEAPTRPHTHRRVSSVPSMDMPIIPRQRKMSQPITPVRESAQGRSKTPDHPASAPPKLLERREPELKEDENVEMEDTDRPPPVPPHRSPSPATPVTLKGSKTPDFTPKLPAYKTKRRSSSPLKHEYEPSTATESSSESEEEEPSTDEEESLTSNSDEELDDDIPTPLMPIGQPRQSPKVSPPGSVYTAPTGTITPSQSASNTPYRTVPRNSGIASKSIATIWTWSDAGRWDQLHPYECSIVVTPGRIEAFEMSAAHSKPFLADGEEIIHPEGKAPLLAQELTPLVPLRRTNAIDICVRSPPTAHSRLKCGTQIMFRSPNPTDCGTLYGLINQSRINNPTYLALQNARGPHGQSSWAEVMDRQNAARTEQGSSGGWFGGTLGRRSSYRKTSTRAASISAATESSVGTMNTALKSALGRLSFNRNGRFNIRGSTLGSRSINSFDTGSSGSGSGANTPPNEIGRAPGAPAGITNTKCRLYERDTFSSKWRDMGAARLTIMLPDPASLQVGIQVRQGKGSPGMRDPSQEKRIVVVGKAKGDVLLDVTLAETCFERVARSGIAVSVWEDVVGPSGMVGTVGARGGVSGARARVFMIQMKTERECAYSFSLLGKLRY
ncbi:hypothetical protein P154DRAFT_525648 [Amniculicola lignicola CBS 123094]|uniref:Uncharacterized protein n=1 Tax=Amniculicola lignicola CBS 123094 TaxID=1392246 RepID=A0A6A5WFG0_9PLEO|nr:hypothetical protein P154DRAFT_525648 [Amniculicola lignicola CBS 123094]